MLCRVGPVVVALLVAGCGGTDAPARGDPTTTAPSAETGAIEVVAVEAAPCDLITEAEVAFATALPVAASGPEGPIGCAFDLGHGVSVFVTADDGQGRPVGPAAVLDGYQAQLPQGGAEPVEGLGESALYAPQFRTIAVDAGGGRFIAVGVNGGFEKLKDPREALIDLARTALARL